MTLRTLMLTALVLTAPMLALVVVAGVAIGVERREPGTRQLAPLVVVAVTSTGTATVVPLTSPAFLRAALEGDRALSSAVDRSRTCLASRLVTRPSSAARASLRFPESCGASAVGSFDSIHGHLGARASFPFFAHAPESGRSWFSSEHDRCLPASRRALITRREAAHALPTSHARPGAVRAESEHDSPLVLAALPARRSSLHASGALGRALRPDVARCEAFTMTTTDDSDTTDEPVSASPMRLGLGLALALLAHDDEVQHAVLATLDAAHIVSEAEHWAVWTATARARGLVRLVLFALAVVPRGLA